MKRVLIILLGLSSLILVPATGAALTINSARDCDANAVINCGALNFTELQNRYSQPGVANIYSSFGISSQDINNIDGTAVEGTVTNRGNVWIQRSSGLCPDIDQSTLSSQNQQAVKDNPNLCLVATDAMTAGRQNIAGSTSTTVNGTTFYMRPPSVSFQQASLPAFVAMQNGKFNFAILASCGNPVKATPVIPITKTAVVPKVKSSVTTTPVTQSQSQSIVVNQPPATTTTTVTTPAPQPAPVTKALPNTGAGGVISLAGISTILGTVGHFVYNRRRLFN